MHLNLFQFECNSSGNGYFPWNVKAEGMDITLGM